MDAPVKLEDLKIVQGHSGRGLQIVCATCRCINWNHLQMPIALWACRNCGRALSHNFPELVEKFLVQEKQEAAARAAS